MATVIDAFAGALGNYPLNSWYVAATSDEVGRQPLGREILGAPILLYRREDGQVVALADMCPHRAAALSRGTLDGDNVVCGYHGSVFGPDGRCVRVPSQASVPFDYDVRTYPTREVGPVIWIWMGLPGRADHRLPPELPWLIEDEWEIFFSRHEVRANYLDLHDNSLDFTHLPHVHKELSPQGYGSVPPTLDIEVSEYSVSYQRTFPVGPIPTWQARATGLAPDRQAVIQESGMFIAPGVHLVNMDIHVPDPGAGEQRSYLRPWIRAFTPINQNETRLFSWVARNYRLGNEDTTKVLRAVHDRLIAEDAQVVEEVSEHSRRYPEVAHHRLVNADSAAVQVHEIVQMMLVRERVTGSIPRRLTGASTRPTRSLP